MPRLPLSPDMEERDVVQNGVTPAKYQRGAVKRVTMHNFLTYDDVSVVPGPQLNLVIGPNGTGKSTLVAALVLGLGGGPELLGRAKKVGNFVKDGTEEAMIELELFEEAGNHVITRIIGKNSRSVWKYAGKVTAVEKIKEIVTRLNVQVDNLCQILPQEKVQDFVRLDAKGLLHCTEKAVGYPGMAEDHLKLQSADEDDGKLKEQISQHQNTVDNQNHDIATLQPIVDNQLKRKKYENSVKLLKERREWLFVDAALNEHDRLKAAKQAAQQKLRDSEKGLQPLKKTADQCQKQAAAFKLKLESRSKDLSRLSQPLEQLKSRVETAEEGIDQLQRERQQRAQRECERRERAAALQQRLDYVNAQLAEQGEVDAQLLSDIAGCDTALRKLSARDADSQAQLETLSQDLDQLQGRIKGRQAELNRVRSVRHQRLEMLRRRKDVYNAVMWLRENGDKFQHKVYEPIVMLLEMVDVKYARYVQAVIPARDRYAFTCESRDDMNRFLREMRDKQKLRVSCVLSDPTVLLSSFRPALPREEIRALGFTHTVGELFSAPDAIRRYLYKSCQLHNIPVADVDRNMGKEVVDAASGQRNLSRFMVAGYLYSSGRSKYSGEAWVSSTQIGRADDILALTTDKCREASLVTEIAEADKQKQAVQERFDAAKAAAHEVARELDQQRKMKQALTARRDQRRILEGKRRLAQRSLQDCEAGAVDLAAHEAETTTRVQAQLEAIGELQTQIVNTCAKCQRVVLEREAVRVQHDLATRLAADAARAHEEANAALAEERKAAEEADAAFRHQKTEWTRLRTAAVQFCGLPDDGSLQAQLERRFRMLPKTLENVEVQLREKQALAAMLGDEDAEALQRYDRLVADRMKVQAAVGELTRQLDRQKSDTAAVRKKWTGKLQQIVEQVDHFFARFFADMDCAGEVTISRGADPEKVAHFGICVRVKFRAAEPLCELSATHHSGGERSVSTMLYIMALQQLGATSVPFHCVDEINQGMDVQNERRVFDLVVAAACRRGGAQYFLITPKLLPHLSYPARDLTVLCVFNSPTMLPHTAWNVGAFCRKRRQVNRAVAAR